MGDQLCEIPRIVKVLESKSTLVGATDQVAGGWEEGMGN